MSVIMAGVGLVAGGTPTENSQVMTGGVRDGCELVPVLLMTVMVLYCVSVDLTVVVVMGSLDVAVYLHDQLREE